MHILYIELRKLKLGISCLQIAQAKWQHCLQWDISNFIRMMRCFKLRQYRCVLNTICKRTILFFYHQCHDVRAVTVIGVLLQTRVLVTHNITHLSKMDLLIVMTDGQISETGKYNELLQSHGAFSDFIRTHLTEIRDVSSGDDLTGKVFYIMITWLGDWHTDRLFERLSLVRLFRVGVCCMCTFETKRPYRGKHDFGS